MELDGKKILVTGADGFIGSHLVESLVGKVGHIRALSYYNSFGNCGWLESISPDARDAIEIVSGDIRDPYFVKTIVQDCDVVFHLAALIAIPYSYVSPESYIDTNIKGTLNVIQAAKECSVEKIIHTSTSEVYGSALYVPIDEEHPLQPQSPYSASKIGADQITMSFYNSFELPVSILRPFNTYGPRQSARAVIPTIISQILNGYKEISLGNLDATRDFTFVSDTAAAFKAVAECDEAVGKVMNSGSSFEISIGDLAGLIAEVMDADVKISVKEERLRPEKSEVNRLFSSTDKIMSLTDWKAEHQGTDGFKCGLKKTIDWFSDPENLKNYKADIYNI